MMSILNSRLVKLVINHMLHTLWKKIYENKSTVCSASLYIKSISHCFDLSLNRNMIRDRSSSLKNWTCTKEETEDQIRLRPKRVDEEKSWLAYNTKGIIRVCSRFPETLRKVYKASQPSLTPTEVAECLITITVTAKRIWRGPFC